MIYTKDNPKLVKNSFSFEERKTFTGVVKDEDNHIIYYLNGEYHREDGPAVEVGHNKWWLLNGRYHREDGPAIEYANGSKEWFLNGKRHREDGPAVELPNGCKEWHLNGTRYGWGHNFTNESWTRFVKLELLK